MSAVTRLGLYGGPRPSLGAGVAIASATVGGVISFTETLIVDGAQVTTITLVNDTWVTAGATFNAQRQNIIDGFDSAQVEATGWNAEVRDKEVVTAVVRTSDTVVTITWTASPLYDITSDEVITATVPSTALSGGVELTGTPTIGVTADVPVVAGASTGGSFAFMREQLRYKEEDERRQRKARKAKARKIKDKLDREIALAFIAREEGEAQRKDLERMTRLANEYKGDIIADNARIAQTIEDAVRLQTFSRMQKLSRELNLMREEEEFLLLATKLLLEQ